MHKSSAHVIQHRGVRKTLPVKKHALYSAHVYSAHVYSAHVSGQLSPPIKTGKSLIQGNPF